MKLYKRMYRLMEWYRRNGMEGYTVQTDEMVWEDGLIKLYRSIWTDQSTWKVWTNKMV